MYSKSLAPRVVLVTLEFKPELHEGQFSFPLRRSSRKEKDAADQLTAVGATGDPVDWLADMLVEPPSGYPDFPLTEAERAKVFESDESVEYKAIVAQTPASDKPLPERVRSYFLDVNHRELVDMAVYARDRYYLAVLPQYFFR